jgi:hypothetical protein
VERPSEFEKGGPQQCTNGCLTGIGRVAVDETEPNKEHESVSDRCDWDAVRYPGIRVVNIGYEGSYGGCCHDSERGCRHFDVAAANRK